MAIQHYISLRFPRLQSYIFQGETLLDTVGRSVILERLIYQDAASSPLATVLKRHPDVTVLSAGAGSIVLGSTAADQPAAVAAARSFVSDYTRQVHELAPSLTPVVQLLAELPANPAIARLKAEAASPISLASSSGYAVLRDRSTASPAERLLKRPENTVRASSREYIAARDAGKDWYATMNKNLADWLKEDKEDSETKAIADRLKLSFSTDQSLLGTAAGFSSKLALITADINDLGDRLHGLTVENPESLSTVSRHLRSLGGELIRFLAARITAGLDTEEYSLPAAGTESIPALTGAPDELSIELSPDRDTFVLPFLPLIAAGDDFAIIAESRIAWSLTELLLQFFDRVNSGDIVPELKKLLNTDTEPLTLGVGIAVIPQGYSTIQAHELAESLTKNAKRHRRNNLRAYNQAHVIDWELAGAGRSDSALSARLAGHSRKPYFRPAVPHNNTGGEVNATWFRLLHSLNPHVPGGLRSEQGSQGKPGWAGRRSFLKSDLLAAVLSQEAEQAAAVLQQLLQGQQNGYSPFLPLIGELEAGAERVDIPFLLDQIELLDDHLHLHGLFAETGPEQAQEQPPAVGGAA